MPSPDLYVRRTESGRASGWVKAVVETRDEGKPTDVWRLLVKDQTRLLFACRFEPTRPVGVGRTFTRFSVFTTILYGPLLLDSRESDLEDDMP